jgi:hypothetical protein
VKKKVAIQVYVGFCTDINENPFANFVPKPSGSIDFDQETNVHLNGFYVKSTKLMVTDH